MILALIQVGSALSFGQRAWSYLELSVLLFSIGAVVWSVLSVRKEHNMPRTEPAAEWSTDLPLMPPLTSRAKERAMNTGKALGILLVGCILGLPLGYGWRSYQYKVNRPGYEREYAAWKESHVEYLKLYAAWSARQPKENK